MSSSLEDSPNILVLDHLNINHEKGRHDLLRAFYFDVLGCAIDPRKLENLEKGRKTLWANCGIHQFHFSEGAEAQVFDGVVTVAFESLDGVRQRLANAPAVLAESAFAWEASGDDEEEELRATDPWGTTFRLVADPTARDERGAQPGPASEPVAVPDLRVHVPPGASLAGVERFYSQVLGAGVVKSAIEGGGGGGDELVLAMSPKQTLTFRERPDKRPVAHEDLSTMESEDGGGGGGGGGGAPVNNGAHVSLYVRDLPAAFRRAEALGCVFVNHRFSRRAYTLDEAVDQCMFRVLDVVDPLQQGQGEPAKPILRLEHEVRSATKKDGSKYKSAPFDDLAAIGVLPPQKQEPAPVL